MAREREERHGNPLISRYLREKTRKPSKECSPFDMLICSLPTPLDPFEHGQFMTILHYCKLPIVFLVVNFWCKVYTVLYKSMLFCPFAKPPMPRIRIPNSTHTKHHQKHTLCESGTAMHDNMFALAPRQGENY